MWVQFDAAATRGTIMTLYDSAQPNYPSSVRELLRVTSDAVRVSLFENETALVMPWPTSQRINDGHWHHVAFVWNGDDGTYALIWNAIKIYANNGYGMMKQLDIK